MTDHSWQSEAKSTLAALLRKMREDVAEGNKADLKTLTEAIKVVGDVTNAGVVLGREMGDDEDDLDGEDDDEQDA